MSSVLVDTNVALYLLGGDRAAAGVLHGQSVHLSVITELELLGYPEMSPPEEAAIEAFLADCVIVGLTEVVKREAIALRRETRLKLPDAIVAATARAERLPLVTADQAFTRVEGLPVVLYAP